MRKRILLTICFFCLLNPTSVFALPLIDNTGNLLSNGNFEEGTTHWVTTTSNSPSENPSAFTLWSQWVLEPPVSTRQVSNPAIDGEYSGRIRGNYNSGIFQYSDHPAGLYTLSAWIYVRHGTAHIGAAFPPLWDGSNSVSETVTSLHTWQYVSVSFEAVGGYGGAFIYCASDDSDFLVDGAWLNAGGENLSPYASIVPTHVPVPEPTTMLLLASSLVGLAGVRRKFRHN